MKASIFKLDEEVSMACRRKYWLRDLGNWLDLCLALKGNGNLGEPSAVSHANSRSQVKM